MSIEYYFLSCFIGTIETPQATISNVKTAILAKKGGKATDLLTYRVPRIANINRQNNVILLGMK